MASAAIAHFGAGWLERGAMDVRLRAPVCEGDEVVVTTQQDADGHVRIEAGESASGAAWMNVEACPRIEIYPQRPVAQRVASVETLIPGELLGTLSDRIDLAQSRITAPLDASVGPDRLAHPAVLLSFANQIFLGNFVLGPWLHGASEVRNFSAVRDGEEIQMRGRIEDRFERKGHEFVVLDLLLIAGKERVAAHIRHTAIWRPRFTQTG